MTSKRWFLLSAVAFVIYALLNVPLWTEPVAMTPQTVLSVVGAIVFGSIWVGALLLGIRAQGREKAKRWYDNFVAELEAEHKANQARRLKEWDQWILKSDAMWAAYLKQEEAGDDSEPTNHELEEDPRLQDSPPEWMDAGGH